MIHVYNINVRCIPLNGRCRDDGNVSVWTLERSYEVHDVSVPVKTNVWEVGLCQKILSIIERNRPGLFFLIRPNVFFKVTSCTKHELIGPFTKKGKSASLYNYAQLRRVSHLSTDTNIALP